MEGKTGHTIPINRPIQTYKKHTMTHPGGRPTAWIAAYTQKVLSLLPHLKQIEVSRSKEAHF